MTRRLDAPVVRAFRPLVAVAAALALSACAAQQGAEATAQRGAVAPQRHLPVLLTVEPTEEVRIAHARDGQLQTPLRLSPEATGAPPPRARNPHGQTITAERLVAAGADITPDLRVWHERGGLGRLRHGPWPASAADLALTPGVRVAPN
ncbi:hypothetical protein DLJ49_09270 [Rhodovulum sp. 12E13]|uniref:hypothetical protein n=1 Tax=Rhodovulum sp. 12E13 TaxID=2203891 RepID=UPI000E193A06|nr:hypothetical protein [Rhodovulum sp. 12E13]RDC72801.1 hypothetical protein DLJ49_09270 [Rhodovulum sp. 12E13]